MRLLNKVAIITGGSNGIGLAAVTRFIEEGAKVVIADLDEGQGKVIEEGLIGEGKDVYFVQVDVANRESVQNMVKAVIAKYGKIDILVNNAGITKDMLLIRMSEREFDRVIEVNLKGTFNCTKEASRAMLKAGGSIINMTSVVGLNGNAGQSNYAASKAGVIGFTKSVAKEFAGKKLRVNAIAPGFIETDMTQVLADKVKEGVMRNIPMKRFGASDEVAKVALFLASDLSSYVTGEVIKVDGGMAM